MSDATVRFDPVELERVLVRMDERAQSVDLGEVGQVISTAVDDKIQNEGQVGIYPRWPELAESTIAYRGSGARMLQRTGLLANLQVVVEGEQSVVVQSPAPYAGFHVEGTKRMPKRDFFELDFDAVLDQCGLRLLEHVDED